MKHCKEIGRQIRLTPHVRSVPGSFVGILGMVFALTPSPLVRADNDLVKKPRASRLLFREDWKTTPAELPITQDHVATEDLVLVMHGPGKRGLKKSHHDKPADDPFYLWSGQCERRWAFSLRPKHWIDLSAADARLRLRTKQSGGRELHTLIKLPGGRWYISEQSVPTSTDWKEFELKIADLDWSRFDVLNIDRGKDESPESLEVIEEIGLTDLRPGGGSKASSRVDWIAVYGHTAAVSNTADARIKRSAVVSTTVAGCRQERFSLRSHAMGRDVRAVVVLPPQYDAHPGEQYAILYALHGRGAPYTSWASMTPLLKRLQDKPMIVACFDAGDASCYLDAPSGGLVDKSVVYRRPRGKPNHQTEEQYQQLTREWETAPGKVKSLYTTFFFEEFVPALDHLYRVDQQRRAVTGFSLGGFGALHYALERPGMFLSISGLSNAFFDEQAIQNSMRKRRSSLRSVLGDYESYKQRYLPANQFKRVEAFAKAGKKLPPVLLHCGLKDELLNANRKMRDTLTSAGYQVAYLESEGSHDWTFWKNASEGVIDFHWEHF